MDALARMPYNVNSDNSEQAELVFDADDVPQHLKGEERIVMFINRYDAGLKNAADQLTFVIEKYADASGTEGGKNTSSKRMRCTASRQESSRSGLIDEIARGGESGQRCSAL